MAEPIISLSMLAISMLAMARWVSLSLNPSYKLI
jgi:hypothetical protein